VRDKRSLVGVQGWIPIVEKRLPFEATISLMLLQANPGVPVPVKLERRHAGLVPLDAPLAEEVGVALAEWARGGAAAKATKSKDKASATDRRIITDKAAALKLTGEQAIAVLERVAGVKSTKDIPADKVLDVIDALEKEAVPA